MPNHPDPSRRNFLKQSSVLGAAVVAGKMTSGCRHCAAAPALESSNRESDAHAQPGTHRIPRWNLQPGRPGHHRAAGQRSRAVAIVERALDLGVNYIDTAAM